MIRDQFLLDLARELIVNNFAGGGGASCGIELALGRHVDIAINHAPEAVAMHTLNHPQTQHHCESVWDIDPLAVTQGQRVERYDRCGHPSGPHPMHTPCPWHRPKTQGAI